MRRLVPAGSVYYARVRAGEGAAARDASPDELVEAARRAWAAPLSTSCGRPAEGMPLIEKAMRLDPHYPYIYRFWLGHALQSLGRYDEAATALQRVVDLQPDFFGGHLHAAAVHGCAGDIDQAHREAAEVLRLRPSFSIRREAAKLPYRDGAILQRVVDGWRQAGLPE